MDQELEWLSAVALARRGKTWRLAELLRRKEWNPPPYVREFLAAVIEGRERIKRRPGATSREREDRVIARALKLLDQRLAEPAERYLLNSPGAVHAYARLRLAELGREVFVVVFLDAEHRLIAIEELFQGTLTHTTVYPREVARAALRHNAAAVVLIHNHPSGDPEFSAPDHCLTEELRSTLKLIEVNVLDHVLIVGTRFVSLASLEAVEKRDVEAASKEKQARLFAAAKAARERRRRNAKEGEVLV